MHTISLAEAEPEFAHALPAAEQAAASETRLPVTALPTGAADIKALFERSNAFGGLLIEGMLLQKLRIGDHTGLRLIGPGDLLSVSGAPRSMLIVESTCRATEPARLALLGDELLTAARRWPRLMAGMQARYGEQSDRLVTLAMICQVSRVDERLLALLWLLAESWGHVTPNGTKLPIRLTHSVLAGMIGARRPTVTLAIGKLTERGAIERLSRGWLLRQHPAATNGVDRRLAVG